MNNKKKKIQMPIISCFSKLEDPRVIGKVEHKLIDIIVITLCAVICGARHFSQIPKFGNAKYFWLKNFLELKHGIPSEDTFSRVFSLIPAEKFLKCFQEWINRCYQITRGEIIAIDGKTLRRSHHKRDNKAAIHMVNVFATANGIALSQQKVSEKSNEITAIPKLLKMLELNGCIITIDAMGCQKGIAKLIKLQGADYVLSVKGNQGSLHKKVKHLFEQAEKLNYQNMVFKTDETMDKGHGRLEIRHYSLLPLMYAHQFKKTWAGLQTFIKVKSVCYQAENKPTQSERYYISSLPLKEHHQIIKAIRNHWLIENRLHWCLDIGFREDECRIRKGYAPENFAAVRQLVLNYLRLDKSMQASIETKRLVAGWDENYLQKVIGF